MSPTSSLPNLDNRLCHPVGGISYCDFVWACRSLIRASVYVLGAACQGIRVETTPYAVADWGFIHATTPSETNLQLFVLNLICKFRWNKDYRTVLNQLTCLIAIDFSITHSPFLWRKCVLVKRRRRSRWLIQSKIGDLSTERLAICSVCHGDGWELGWQSATFASTAHSPLGFPPSNFDGSGGR